MYSEITSNKRKSIILVSLFIVIIILLGLSFDWFYGGNSSYIGVVLAIIIALIMTSVSYFKGDKIALKVSGAIPLDKENGLYIHRLVENLCITAGMPLPKIYIIPDIAINAFATGRDPKNSSIALTQGAIEKLNKAELEGVIAHELSHIKNYDIRFMMLIAVMVGSIAILANILLRSGLIFGGRNRNREGGGQIGGILMIVGIVIAILSPIIAEIIKLAISRKREFMADASGSLLTRYPEGLASALEKIELDHQSLQKTSTATAHLFISSPFKNKKKRFSKMLSTHPPIKERIQKLRSMGI